ncbi:hypothetical protein FBU30_001590 [Linnemannia zychae]|nr:hypothetical protein FBU30_001590 [Linnemannia zychae]
MHGMPMANPDHSQLSLGGVPPFHHRTPPAAIVSMNNNPAMVIQSAIHSPGTLSPRTPGIPGSPIGSQAQGMGFGPGAGGMPSPVGAPSYKTSTAALLQQQRQQQLLQQQQLQQQQQPPQQQPPQQQQPQVQQNQQTQLTYQQLQQLQQQQQQQQLHLKQQQQQSRPIASSSTSQLPQQTGLQRPPIPNANPIIHEQVSNPAPLGNIITTGPSLSSIPAVQSSPVSPTESKPTSLQLLRQRQQELELQRKKESELRKQRELEEQKQREMEEQRQRKLEEQKKCELEEQRLRELEEQRLRELEEQRQREIEEQREREAEEQRLRDIEQQRHRELEEQRYREMEEQRLQEMEEQRLREIEEQRLRELEEQRHREIEEQRLREMEEQRHQEIEEQRHREMEEQRLREMEEQRVREFEDLRHRDLEEQRKRELELLRQRDIEQQKQRELEKQRLAELHRQQQLELEMRHRREEQMQREEEERRQREFELQRRQQFEQHSGDLRLQSTHRLSSSLSMDTAQANQGYSESPRYSASSSTTDSYQQQHPPPISSNHSPPYSYGPTDPSIDVRMSYSQQEQRDMPPPRVPSPERQSQVSSIIQYMDTDPNAGTSSMTAIKLEDQPTVQTIPHHGTYSSLPPPQQPIQYQSHQPQYEPHHTTTPFISLDDAQVHDAPIGPSQIFKATYSGVPVYEMICKGVAVMRRRSDSYLNATQILKVADFDKPQRTRILEREVQKGEHEKVQGGYGKYQGTWVPYERGLQLCQEYGVVNLLQPILEYQATKTSPPLAPKHITAASNRPRKPREPRPSGSTPIGTPKMKKAKFDRTSQILPKQMDYDDGHPENGSMLYEDGDAGGAHSGTDDEDEDDTSTGSSDDSEDSDISMDDTMSAMSDRSLSQSRSPSLGRSHDDLSSDDMSDKESHSSYSSSSPSPSPSIQTRQLSLSPYKKHRRQGDELSLGNEDLQQTMPQRKRRVRRGNGTVEGDGEISSQAEEDANEERENSVIRDASPSSNKDARRSTSRTRASDQEDRKSTTSSVATATATVTASADVAARGPHAEALLEYFISDALDLPTILTQPPSDLDVNVVIDEEGHTALHWAAAMGKPDVVKLLIQLGADIYRVNTDGQTSLMRSVLFSNSFEHKDFPALLELLQKTIFTIDKDDQTVFHHVAMTASQRGKVHAARYYLECLLAKLANHPSELASIINVQDHEGDTALTIAARLRIGGKKMVKMLLDAGADPKIRNHTGKNTEDYLQENEQAIPSAMASTTAVVANKMNNIRGHDSTAPTADAASKVVSTLNGVTPAANDILTKPLGRLEGPTPQKNYPEHIQDPRVEALPTVVGPTNVGATGMKRKAEPRIHQGRRHSSSTPGSLYRQLQEANSKFGLTPVTTISSTLATDGRTLASSTQDVVIPTVSDLFGQLTHSYEKDIFEKDQDIVEANTLLQGMQTEIWEGRRTIQGLKFTVSTLSKAEDEVKALEKKIKREIHTRQRLRLEELIKEQEHELRQKLGREGAVNGNVAEAKDERVAEGKDKEQSNAAVAQTAATNAQGVLPTALALGPSESTINGLGTAEIISTGSNDMDTTATLTASTTPLLTNRQERMQSLENETMTLRAKLEELQRKRKEHVDEMVTIMSQQSKKRHEYQRLIALCCNVSIDQVDELLQPLLTSLGEDSLKSVE